MAARELSRRLFGVYKPHKFSCFLIRYSSHVSTKPIVKRPIDRAKFESEPGGNWSVVAYNISEELKIENTQRILDRLSEYTINQLPRDLEAEAVMLSSKYLPEHSSRSTSRPLNNIFLFRDGSIVFWGVPYETQKQVLYGLSSLKVNPNESDEIQEEREHIVYKLNSSLDKSKLVRDEINLSTNRDPSCLHHDQFAFSHAVALSVKLGIWEMTLDKYIDSVQWITERMKQGKVIQLTKEEIFRKTGILLGLKHSLNLSSDLLDLPDIYWDRSEQEDIFLSMNAFLNIKRRTSVMNEKLNNCCELMQLLANHMNDCHHVRLEWLIISLIAVEVMFEIARHIPFL